jgi:hypothetical protein
MNPEDLGDGIRERTPIRGKVVSGKPLFRPLIWLVGTNGFKVGSRGSGVQEVLGCTGQAPRDQACARRESRARGRFRAAREGTR